MELSAISVGDLVFLSGGFIGKVIDRQEIRRQEKKSTYYIIEDNRNKCKHMVPTEGLEGVSKLNPEREAKSIFQTLRNLANISKRNLNIKELQETFNSCEFTKIAQAVAILCKKAKSKNLGTSERRFFNKGLNVLSEIIAVSEKGPREEAERKMLEIMDFQV